jgi:trans-aconitate 2-methyltransferase
VLSDTSTRRERSAARRERQRWNPAVYDATHSFVWRFGEVLLKLLDPRAGERVLDIGCGTAHLTKRICESGADVVGIDLSKEMIEHAKEIFPEIDLRVMDVTQMTFDEPFDKLFSNAVLHWVSEPLAAAHRMRDAIKTGGRLVVEMGGHGNIATIYNAIHQTLGHLGIPDHDLEGFVHFPRLSEYTGILERNGFAVADARLVDRPTPLEGGPAGLRQWVAMFKGPYAKLVPSGRQEEFFLLLEDLCRGMLWAGDHWIADYRRLRIVATAV